jgi:hypothetical protein
LRLTRTYQAFEGHLRSLELFGIPALIFLVACPHMLSWLKVIVPNMPSILQSVVSLNVFTMIRFFLYAWKAIFWGACFVGLCYMKPWAWWLSVVMDGNVIGSYIYQFCAVTYDFGAISVSRLWEFQWSFPDLVLPGMGMPEFLAISGLALLFLPRMKSYYRVDLVIQLGLPVRRFVAAHSAFRIAGRAITAMTRATGSLIIYSGLPIRIADSVILGVIAVTQLLLALASLVLFIFFIPYAIAIPLFGLYLLAGIASAIYLGSRHVVARILSLTWGWLLLAITIGGKFETTNPMNSRAMLAIQAVRVALLYLLFSSIVRAGHLLSLRAAKAKTAPRN